MIKEDIYSLNPEETKLFKNVSGIYALIHNEEIIYIGQSKSIQERLNKHRESEYNIKEILHKIKKEEGRCNRTKQLLMYQYITEHKEEMKFTILKKTTDRNKWEEHYITLYKPKFNYKGVDIPY